MKKAIKLIFIVNTGNNDSTMTLSFKKENDFDILPKGTKFSPNVEGNSWNYEGYVEKYSFDEKEFITTVKTSYSIAHASVPDFKEKMKNAGWTLVD